MTVPGCRGPGILSFPQGDPLRLPLGGEAPAGQEGSEREDLREPGAEEEAGGMKLSCESYHFWDKDA